jgi:hypothetical protein
MKIQGFTIGAGRLEELAREMAVRNGELHGIPWAVVDASPVDSAKTWNPSWWKLWAWDLFPDADVLVHMDADVWCARPWPVAKFVEARAMGFVGVMDEPLHRQHAHECELYGMDLRSYVNGGCWMARREACRGAFELARGLGPSWGRWLEQNALNYGLERCEVEKFILPRVWNWLAHGVPESVPRDVRCAHFCGYGGDADRVRAAMNLWKDGLDKAAAGSDGGTQGGKGRIPLPA